MDGIEQAATTRRRHGYPRPMLERAEWWSLNGKWEFAIDAESRWRGPDEATWDAEITVPFAPETPASGVENTGFYSAAWYRRTFDAPELAPDQRVLLHLGAVDYRARVWVNGVRVGDHDGGYTPFYFDVTHALRSDGPQVVVVHAHDDPQDLAKPRGKQDWQITPHSIWYPRTTGIWQTVWIERVNATHIQSLTWKPNVERWEIDLQAAIQGHYAPGTRLHLKLHIGDHVIADDSYLVVAGEVHRRIALSDPGIDDYRNELLWYPNSPTLIYAELQLRDPDGNILDSVRSYTAMRSIGVQGDRFVLNGRPYYLRLALHQGYWQNTGTTAPDDAALRRDIELVKAMGFNGVRYHQCLADPRFLYWADRMGLLVTGEMPSAYRFTQNSVARLTREWAQVIRRDISHPCIMAWIPFNESWGVPDLPDSPAQRHYVQALYHLTKTLDPTRPVIGNDGWESVATDIIGIHDYDDTPARIYQRYNPEEVTTRLFKRERPGGRMLLLNEEDHTGQPILLSEFGGITMSKPGDGWGYSRVEDAGTLAERYQKLMDVVRSLPLFAGFCYTQFCDTFQETNGLLREDRTPKFPLEQIAAATAGRQAVARDRELELSWRERMMRLQLHRYAMPDEDHRISPAP